MRKTLLFILLSVFSIVLHAQINGDGYYRVKNYGSDRYIYVYDNTGKISVEAMTADMGAIELWKNPEKIISDPASIIYIKKTGSLYDLESQGTGAHQIIGYYVNITKTANGTYQVSASLGGVTKYLSDNQTISSMDEGALGTDGGGKFRSWTVLPVNDDDNYFGIKPTIELYGKYYQPFYAAFPFTLSEGMKAYYVSKIASGTAYLTEIEGTIPAATPVLIECLSKNTEDNKLHLMTKDGTKPSDNLLKGVYFNNKWRTAKSKDAQTAYNASTMRVLTVKDGKLTYSTDSSLKFMPANQSYLSVPAGTEEVLSVKIESDKVKATSIQLDQTTLTLVEAGTATLKATVLPEETADKTVKWSSSDESVAKVDENSGTVTAIAEGTATITATTADGSNLKATCAVTVTGVKVETITLDKTEVELMEGGSLALTATVKPDNAKDKTIIWSSSDEKVATVDDRGSVSAICEGVATITAEAKDGSGIKATCKVTVKSVKVETITLDKTEAELMEGGALTLTATVKPDNAKNKTLNWSSSDEAIAKVDDKGNVSAIAEGVANITVEAKDGSNIKATCKVTVKSIKVETITLDMNETELFIGESQTLIATVKPDDAKNKTLKWSSSDEAIAQVNENGVINALAEGIVTITAEAMDGSNIKATCKVSVKSIKAESLTLDKTEANLFIGESLALIATIAPENATNKAIRWSSSDENVAKVDENGKVSALADGTATITVETTDGNELKATCTVTVKSILVEGLKLNMKETELEEGKTVVLKATVSPENATNSTLNWSSSDEKIATVDESGKVTAIGEGTATITVETTDGSNLSATCTVKVVPILVKDLSLNTSYKEITIDETYTLIATINPSNAKNKKLEWSSSDESIATVDANGNVKGIAEGLVTITATTTDGSNLSDSCEIKVIDGSSISKLQIEPGQEIFDILGRKVEKITTKGIYIINNRKVVVK